MSSKKPDTRERILIAAWKLLESGSGAGARMGDIAKQAGISRQAVYLHFPTRAELLIATTRYLDEVKDARGRFAESRRTERGTARLDAFIEAWGNYIPEVYPVARAILALQGTDAAAAAAWDDRMQAVRQGCQAAVTALERDGALAPGFAAEVATDILWTLLSVRNWEQFTGPCGWSQGDYIAAMTRLARRALVADAADAGS